jgi:hypothetical protein
VPNQDREPGRAHGGAGDDGDLPEPHAGRLRHARKHRLLRLPGALPTQVGPPRHPLHGCKDKSGELVGSVCLRGWSGGSHHKSPPLVGPINQVSDSLLLST